MTGQTIGAITSPEAMSDADTIRQAAAGWVVHPDIRGRSYRIVNVDRGRVAIRAICTGDGALRLASRQVGARGRVATSLAQVLAWLSAREGEL